MEALAWPAVGLILGLIALLLFRKPIIRLLDRTEKVSKEGLQAHTVQEQHIDKPVSKADDLLKIFDNQLVVETEKLIKNKLDNLALKDLEEREKYLLRNVAMVVITQMFDKSYYLIYGSQLSALRYLNDNRGLSLTTSQITSIYNDAVRKYPDNYANYTFENWLGFLVNSYLVQKNGNDIGITVRGTEFLKYLIEQGYSYQKWG
jgi:hypothetical protein